MHTTEMSVAELGEFLLDREREATAARHRWLHALARFEAAGGAQIDGHATTVRWLIARARLSRSSAKQYVQVARALASGRFDATDRALAEGRVSFCQARVITSLPESCAAVEATLLEVVARGCPVADLTMLVARTRQLADPDGEERAARDRMARHGLVLTRGVGGDLIGQLQLDPIDGDLLVEAIESVLASERAAGWPVVPVDERVSTGDVLEPPETPAQRRASALLTLVAAGLDHLERDRPGRRRCQVVIEVPADGPARTGDGTPIVNPILDRALCDADLRAITTAGDEVLAFGKARRRFSRAQRLAIGFRDGHRCQFPGCASTLGLECHHLRHVEGGGPTDLVNGTLLCRFHHHLTHEGGWLLSGGPGRLIAHPPIRGSGRARPFTAA